jgi:hypothetical protein
MRRLLPMAQYARGRADFCGRKAQACVRQGRTAQFLYLILLSELMIK